MSTLSQLLAKFPNDLCVHQSSCSASNEIVSSLQHVDSKHVFQSGSGNCAMTSLAVLDTNVEEQNQYMLEDDVLVDLV